MKFASGLLRGLTLAWVLALATAAVEAQFNYNWGGFGWGGWSSTVQGDIAHGLASLAAGAGQYNQQTAIANSINADTVMRVNQFMFLGQQEANQRQFARNARRVGRTTTTLAENADRLRNRPESGDIDRGDALNVLLDDLTAPALLHGSALRIGGSEIPAPLVREIPFRNAAEAVTICIEQLTNREKFPPLLRSEALTPEREAFVAAAQEASRQAREQGELSSDAVTNVQVTGRALYQKAKSPQVKATPAERDQALNYLKGMAALARIAANPDTLQAMRELKQVETTHIANLIAFMQTYNLRFGPAGTPEQRRAYQTLYPILRADRERFYAALQPQASAVPPSDPNANPTEVFQGLDENQLNLAPKDR
jgi:hypothetical protein